MKNWILIAVAACGGQSRFLGAPLPPVCDTSDTEACAGWMAEQDLRSGGLDVYADPALRDYVQEVADRLVKGTRLPRAPHVVISDHDGTYAAFGNRIVVGRMAIEKLGSEAELAAVVAHELVHVEGRHASVSLYGPDPDDRWLALRRDSEAIADERAVELLERAGYAPAAMSRALDAELPEDDGSDDEHPPRTDRIDHVDKLIADRIDGFDGRTELMRHVDHMVIGRDTRLGTRVDNAWVISVLGIALELGPHDGSHVEGDTIVVRRGPSSLTAYAIGEPWARELASSLDTPATTESPLGTITVGVAPVHRITDAPLSRLEQSVRELLPQPTPGTKVVVIERPTGGLVIELGANSDPDVRARWLHSIRAASEHELAAAEPRHFAIVKAKHAGTVAQLVSTCPDPDAALALDRGDRVLATGDPIKCTNR